MNRVLLSIFLISASSSLGCGAAIQPPPIKSTAALGSVVVYRNGVAYFERRAHVTGNKFELEVPTERLDDFLKSLTIVDAKTNKSLPVSFPTVDRSSGAAKLLISLPHKGNHDIKISYVTESPAWKPSYRLVLGPDSKAKLEAWAVVDNVSGEDWEQVKVGVGSTSALSFRYDLKSVRVVERETLFEGDGLATAPPEGGSPYEIASRELQVLGGFGADELDNVGSQEPMLDAESGAEESEHYATAGFGRGSAAQAAAPASTPSKRRAMTKPASPHNRIVGLANAVKESKAKIRIEGYANSDDKDHRDASLRRANVLRDQLIAQGVSPDQIDAVGTGKLSDSQGVRVVTEKNEQAGPEQAKPQDGAVDQDEAQGQAYFVANAPMSIENEHSAMVSMLDAVAQAEQVYYYDAISDRGSKKYAFRSVLLKNPSKYTLDRGPFTVYAKDQFLGEGLSEAIPAFSEAFIPFALDKKLLVEPEVDTREEIHSLQTIERGIINTETQRIRRTVLTLSNRGDEAAKLFVRHAVPNGWTLKDPAKDLKKLGGAHLFQVAVPAKGATKLVIEEMTPIFKSYDVRTTAGLQSVALFLKSSNSLKPELREKLMEVISMTREMANLQQQIDTAEEQMSTFRTRVDEINIQLVTLRNVVHANKLKQHLATKMQEISERLQERTIEVANLEGKLLTARIGLQDKLAEMTLVKDIPVEKLAAVSGN